MVTQPSLITVPDLSTADLVERARRDLKLTSLSPHLLESSPARDVRGKTLEVRTMSFRYQPSVTLSIQDFWGEDFFGGAAAFVSWLIATAPAGFYTSTEDGLRRGFAYASYRSLNCRTGEQQLLRALGLYSDFRIPLKVDSLPVDETHVWTFVGFREVK